MKKLTFEEVIKRYDEMANGEYDFPSFAAYYVTDNNCDGSKETPYKLKSLCLYCLNPFEPNRNGKYELSSKQKLDFKNKVMSTVAKENVYMF